MAEAIVLVRTGTSVQVEEDAYRKVELKDVFEKVAKMREVEEVATVTGPYDIVAWIKAEDIEEITGPLVDEIRALPGVGETLTNVVVRSS